MISEIALWLQNPVKNYSDGVALFKLYGKSQLLKGLFEKGEDLYTKEKLVKELQKLADQVPPEKTKIAKSLSINHLPKVIESHLSERLRMLNVRKAELINEARKYQSLMWQLPRIEKYNNERKRFAIDIERNFQLIDQIWKELDHYQATGKELPKEQQQNFEPAPREKEEEDFSHLKPEQQVRKLFALRAGLSRAKKEGKPTHRFIRQIEALTQLMNNE
jgi:hypothetical protein